MNRNEPGGKIPNLERNKEASRKIDKKQKMIERNRPKRDRDGDADRTNESIGGGETEKIWIIDQNKGDEG